MSVLPKMLKNRSVFFWIIFVQLIAFAIVTMSVDFNASSVASWFDGFANAPWAIPATIGLYLVMAFVNAPQWMLHAGCGLAFGPIYGSAIAWAATMVSASFDFWLGKRLGADRINRMGGAKFGTFLKLVQKNGFWASMIVRIVPAGPFVLVNLAAGVSRMPFVSFFAGTAIGCIPKIIGFTFFSDGIKSGVTGKGPLYVAITIGIALIWMAVIFIAGARIKRKLAAEENMNVHAEENAIK